MIVEGNIQICNMSQVENRYLKRRNEGREKKRFKEEKIYAYMLLSTNATIINLDKFATHYDKVMKVATPSTSVMAHINVIYEMVQHQAEVACSRIQ